MKKTELLRLLSAGESANREFSRDDIRAEQLAGHAAALSNARGGRVVLGVEDDGTPTGIQRPNLEEWVMDTVFGEQELKTLEKELRRHIKKLYKK